MLPPSLIWGSGLNQINFTVTERERGQQDEGQSHNGFILLWETLKSEQDTWVHLVHQGSLRLEEGPKPNMQFLSLLQLDPQSCTTLSTICCPFEGFGSSHSCRCTAETREGAAENLLSKPGQARRVPGWAPRSTRPWLPWLLRGCQLRH